MPDDKIGDKTAYGVALPKLPKPDKHADKGDQTRPHGGATPAFPKRNGADANIADRQVAEPEVFEDEPTVIATRSDRDRFKLQRLSPAGHAGLVGLDLDRYSVGRASKCDIELHSESASREHADLVRCGDSWSLLPRAGRIVIANGERVRASILLDHKMVIQMGGDELMFLDQESALAEPDTVQTGSELERESASGRRGYVLVAVTSFVIALVAVWLWSS